MWASVFGCRRAARERRHRCLATAAGLGLWLGACQTASRAEPAELVTRVEALTPAPVASMAAPARSREPAPDSAELVRDAFELAPTRCPEVARQAQELSSVLPRELDSDTVATSVTASGCDLTIEYQLVTLDATEVTDNGMRAMRGSVRQELCSDRGALAVMQQGGRFTNVYYDRARTRIGLFSVAADDCGI